MDEITTLEQFASAMAADDAPEGEESQELEDGQPEGEPQSDDQPEAADGEEAGEESEEGEQPGTESPDDEKPCGETDIRNHTTQATIGMMKRPAHSPTQASGLPSEPQWITTCPPAGSSWIVQSAMPNMAAMRIAFRAAAKSLFNFSLAIRFTPPEYQFLPCAH